MTTQETTHPFDRRLFLTASGALALAGAGNSALEQPGGGKPAALPRSSCGSSSPSS